MTSPKDPSETCIYTEVNSNVLSSSGFNNYNIWKYTDLPYNQYGAAQFNGRMLNSVSEEHQGKGVAVFFDGHTTVYSMKNKSIFSNSFIDGN